MQRFIKIAILSSFLLSASVAAHAVSSHDFSAPPCNNSSNAHTFTLGSSPLSGCKTQHSILFKSFVKNVKCMVLRSVDLTYGPYTTAFKMISNSEPVYSHLYTGTKTYSPAGNTFAVKLDHNKALKITMDDYQQMTRIYLKIYCHASISNR